MIQEQDEWLHPAGDDDDWQESFYFNWADPEGRSFTLARIGYRFAAQRTDGLIISMRDGDIDFAYPAANVKHPGPCADEDPSRGMRSKGFVVTMEEPLRRWRLQLEDRDEMDLIFEAFTPAFDYTAEGGQLASDIAGHHFEQSGRVRGWTRFKGVRHEIDAFGQRDKSWGNRAWSELTGWNWITAQFGEDLSFNFMQTFQRDNTFDNTFENGFVFRNGANHAVTAEDVQFSWGAQPHLPHELTLELREATGARHHIRAVALASFPLPRGRVWLEETHARFEWKADGIDRVGHGVIEHVWRAKPMDLVRRAPRLMRAVRRTLRR